jgi:hypothetical protein
VRPSLAWNLRPRTPQQSHSLDRPSVRLHPSHAAALYALVERNGPRNTRIEISNQSAGKRRFLNASITLSAIGEFSCANAAIRAFIMQSCAD